MTLKQLIVNTISLLGYIILVLSMVHTKRQKSVGLA